MIKMTVGIEGMACGMCEAHVNEAIRNTFRVKKVTVRIQKSRRSFLQNRTSRKRT